VNTCIYCLGTVTETTSGAFVLVGEPFVLPITPHAHQTTESARLRPTLLAA
jgi:hypothetical protein